MIVVAGHLIVEPRQRAHYLADCAEVIALARRTAGCLEFAVVADPLEPERIVILERWESRAPMVAFRQDGPSSEQQAAIIGGHVAEYEVSAETVVLGSGR